MAKLDIGLNLAKAWENARKGHLGWANLRVDMYKNTKFARMFKKERKSYAIKEFSPKGKRTPIHRTINARAKGIRFIKKGGRIIPIRPK